MNNAKQHWIVYFIVGVIGFSLCTQIYWNYKNYQTGKQQLMNDVQTSLDKAVDTYFVELAKERSLNWNGDSIKIQHLDIDSLWVKSDSSRPSGKTLALKGYDSGTRTIKGFQQGKVTFKGVQTDSSLSTFIPLDASNVGLERIHINTLLDSLKDPIESLSTRIVVSFSQDELSLQEIDTLFQQELDRKEIDIIYGLRNKEMLGQTKEIRPEVIQMASLSTTTQSPYFVYGNSLSAHYKNITLTVLKKNMLGILLSFLLVGGVIASLLYLLAVIRRQKALAEIKNDLISNITHEFKTPIATIGVALEAIQSFSGEDQNQRTRKYVQMSTEQLDRLNGMVEKLLETASLDRGEVVLNTEPTDLVSMLERLTHSEAMIQAGKEVNFDSSLTEAICHVDKFHFENAINNILDNAVKYGGDKIDVKLSGDSNAVIIQIRDSGNGLEGDHRKRIFEKFYRVPSGNTHDVKGYGIGLYYSMSMIQKHGGELQLISTQPTTFEIRLPYEQ